MTDCVGDEFPEYFEYDFDAEMLNSFSNSPIDNAFNWEPNQESNWETKSISSVSSLGASEFSAETDSLPFFSVETSSPKSEKSKSTIDSEKLRRNREAASRCRKKKRENQLKSQSHMEDLENQLHVIKNENNALLIENKSLKAENRSLREQLASLSLETKASISGVAIFGIVCLFPLFNISPTNTIIASGESSSGYSIGHIVSNMSTLMLGNGSGALVGSGSGTGRVLLSVYSAESSTSMTLYYVGVVLVLLLMALAYQSTKAQDVHKHPFVFKVVAILDDITNQCKMTLPI